MQKMYIVLGRRCRNLEASYLLDRRSSLETAASCPAGYAAMGTNKCGDPVLLMLHVRCAFLFAERFHNLEMSHLDSQRLSFLPKSLKPQVVPP